MGFKRKNTRKSTQEYKKKVEYEIKEEDEDEYKEELVDDVYDLSNQVSKGARGNEADSSDFDPNKMTSNNTSNKQNNGNFNNFKLRKYQIFYNFIFWSFKNCFLILFFLLIEIDTDKMSTTDINDFDFDCGEDLVADEDSVPINSMLKQLIKV